MRCESQWTAGSSWKLVSGDGQIFNAGAIVAAEPPWRLVIRLQHQIKPELKAGGESQCTMELESSGTAVKLSITHTIERQDQQARPAKELEQERKKTVAEYRMQRVVGSLKLDPRPKFDDPIVRDAKELGRVGRIAVHPGK
jgi:hypothetical protein